MREMKKTLMVISTFFLKKIFLLTTISLSAEALPKKIILYIDRGFMSFINAFLYVNFAAFES